MPAWEETSVVHEWSVFAVSEGWRLFELASGEEADVARARKRVEEAMRRRTGEWLMGVIVLCDLDAYGVRTAVRTVATAYDESGGIGWECDEADHEQ